MQVKQNLEWKGRNKLGGDGDYRLWVSEKKDHIIYCRLWLRQGWYNEPVKQKSRSTNETYTLQLLNKKYTVCSPEITVNLIKVKSNVKKSWKNCCTEKHTEPWRMKMMKNCNFCYLLLLFVFVTFVYRDTLFTPSEQGITIHKSNKNKKSTVYHHWAEEHCRHHWVEEHCRHHWVEGSIKSRLLLFTV